MFNVSADSGQVAVCVFVVWIGRTWYGMAHHSSFIPFPVRTGMIVTCALFRDCLFSAIEIHFDRRPICGHRQDLGEVS